MCSAVCVTAAVTVAVLRCVTQAEADGPLSAQLLCHHQWISFFVEMWSTMKARSDDTAFAVKEVLHKLLTHTLQCGHKLSDHPAAAGARFRLLGWALHYTQSLTSGLRYCQSLASALQGPNTDTTVGPAVQPLSPPVLASLTQVIATLQEQLVKAGLFWFATPPAWTYKLTQMQAREHWMAVADFVSSLDATATWYSATSGGGGSAAASIQDMARLLSLLCATEAARLRAWSNPTQAPPPSSSSSGGGGSGAVSTPAPATPASSTYAQLAANSPSLALSDKEWRRHIHVAWAMHPRLAIGLLKHCPATEVLTQELQSLVATHVRSPDVQAVPEAAVLLVAQHHQLATSQPSSRNARANSADASGAGELLQALSTWAAADVVEALNLLSRVEGRYAVVRSYAIRCLANTAPPRVAFFVPQLVQCLRGDADGQLAAYLTGLAQANTVFCHQLLWNLAAERQPPPEAFDPGALALHACVLCL